MFFQVNITPKEKKKKEPITQTKVCNTYSLLLAPFQPPTRIRLDTQINTPVECTLTIHNSNNRSLTASITKIPPQERCVSLSASEWSIQPESSVTLNILWEPKEGGAWRDILQLSDSRRIKYDIPLILTCTDPNKGANVKGGKTKRKNPLGSRIGAASQKTTTSNSSKQVASKVTIKPAEKKSSAAAVKFQNKENVSSNVDFNWMIEQAKTKKLKKDDSPPVSTTASTPVPMNFSKLLDSSSFKLTPLKSKFTCFESNTFHDTIAFTPKHDTNGSSKSESSSISVERKVQMIIRKETYVKIPKSFNVQLSPKIETDDEANEEFDDSLSPKPTEAETEKPQSDISMLFKNVKFTPFKNPKENDNLIFSPTCCSTGNKSNRSKSFSDDSMTQPSSKNVTFDIDTANNFEANNTYELSISPTSTKDSFNFKPTCLAKAFDKNSVDIGFSTPLPVHRLNTTSDYGRSNNQFSKSQMDFGNAKDCLEADLWVKSKNTSLSPISKNLLHSTMDSIKEEDVDFDIHEEKKYAIPVAVVKNDSKVAKNICIEISPPKRCATSKPPIRKISPTKSIKIMKEKRPIDTTNPKKKEQINKSIKSIVNIPGVKIAKLSLAGLYKDKDKSNRKLLKKQTKEVSVKLHDPNDFLTMFCNPDPFAATMTHDPFLASTLYYDDKWIFVQELEFKKWLNALLTPPEHLTADIESTTIDIGKVWQSCRTKEDVTLAETKESVSARYHTNTRLNTLRKAACVMFRKPEVIAALSQTTVCIEKEILIIRPDKDLHRDIGLQKTILELFISYNPLWLRIGLETIYGETIPLQSNNDLIGLSRFLLNRFFSDPFLVKMHSSHMHPNIRLNTFQPLMNKFMLKKFLFVVYFLDYAKRNKLIGHDPCLFHKKALIKDSRTILLTFSRELLSGIGDITKVLRSHNYTVSHKQTYLDEYDYAVMNLCTDLRDGVRLCRVMELITGKRCLTCRCRVPAISRLQKVHNVSIALTTLNEAGYTITGDIDAKSIADGHKEETLSLLWQIIYKFQAPRFEKAAKTLQRWWRSKLWYVYIKKMLRNRKHDAASVIQRAWKCYLARQKLNILRKEYAQKMQLKIAAARKIQFHWRLRKEAKEQQRHYQHMRMSSVKIQRWWRRIKSVEPHVKEFRKQRQLVFSVQHRWRANQLMKLQRNDFVELKKSAIKIQTLWRARCLGRLVAADYQIRRAAIIRVQNKWRAKLLMRMEREFYLRKLRAIKLVQEYWRRYLIMKRDRNYFIALKRSVTVIEKTWIKKHTVIEERSTFLRQKSSAITIQKAWRNYRAIKEDFLLFKRRKNSCLKIQSWWRSVSATKRFTKQRSSCMKLQKWWRSVLLTRKERSNFLALKNSAIAFQKNWKMQMIRRDYERKKALVLKIELWYKNLCLSRKVLNEYLRMKAAVKTIETRRCALNTGRPIRAEFLKNKNTIIVFQRRWRAQLLIKKTRQEYLQTRRSIVKIQSWWKMIQENKRYNQLLKEIKAATVLQQKWRALKDGRQTRETYAKHRSSVILIQRKWRATRLARLERHNFLQKRASAIVMQKYWRSHVALKEYRRKKCAASVIQKWRRHVIAGREMRAQFVTLKESAIKIQLLWRTVLQMRAFKGQRKAAIVIQKNWRSYVALKEYKKKKNAALIIQRWRRHLVLGRNARTEFIKCKSTVIKVQSHWRMKQQMRQYREQREAAIVIQKYWRRFSAMRKYEKKKIAVLFIENWRKHVLFGRQVRIEFLKLKETVLRLQRLYRVKKQMKEYKRQRDAAIRIQQFWRSVSIMRKCKMRYELQRTAVITLQRRYRAIKVAVQVREDYRNTILAIVRIQIWWKSIIFRRTLKMLKEKRKWAVCVIENWWINSSEERRIRQAEKLERQRQCIASTIIQAAWRGYRVRKAASKELAMVRERAKRAADAAVPQATLAFRLQENIEIFKYANNIGQLSISLSSLDVITRLSPNACANVCELNLVEKLYSILTVANRSLPWLDICLIVINILLTLAKFKPTSACVLKQEYTEILARLLNISVDTKEDLFLHTATLMWVLTEDLEYAMAVKNSSRTNYLLSSLYTSINKKLTRPATAVNKCRDRDALPSPNPDWGLRNKRPRTFRSISQAMTSIASRLKILNIA